MSNEIDIGQLGESHFKTWCDETGLTANKSLIDKKGWDYIVQFSYDVPGETKQDKGAEEISAFFQLKTTKHIGNPIQIKLSNWNHMAKIPMPAFVSIILLNKANKVEKVLLVHIGEKEISAILKAMRETKKKLHKVAMKLPMDVAEEIAQPFGTSIKSRILSTINNNFRSYVGSKVKTLETVGYTEFVGRGKFTLNTTLSDLVDFSIGLKTSLPAKDFNIETGLRFDIPDKVHSFPNGIVEFSRKGTEVEIEISNDKGLLVRYPAEVFDPFYLIPSIAPENAKFRIKSDIGEVVIGPGASTSASFTISIPAGDQPFGILARFAKTVSIFSDIDSGFEIAFLSKGNAFSRVNISRPELGEINSDRNVVIVAGYILSISKILGHFMADQDYITSVDDILLQQSDILELFQFLEAKEDSAVQINFKTNAPISEDKKVCIPRVVEFRTRERSYIVIGYYKGKTAETSETSGVRSHSGVFRSKILKVLSKPLGDNYSLDAEWEFATSEVQKVDGVTLFLEKK